MTAPTRVYVLGTNELTQSCHWVTFMVSLAEWTRCPHALQLFITESDQSGTCKACDAFRYGCRLQSRKRGIRHTREVLQQLTDHQSIYSSHTSKLLRKHVS